MICPICGHSKEGKKEAKHLPLFFRCRNCTGYFHEQGPPPHYDESYFAEDGKPSMLGRVLGRLMGVFLWTRKIGIRRTLNHADSKVLDYGCGNGKLVRYLRKHKMNVEGFDPSASAVNLSQKDDLPVFGEIPDKQYDLIMFWHSLEHTDNPMSDLKSILKYLKHDGKLLIAVPNGDSLEAYLTKKNWFCYDWPFHRIHFTPKSLEKMLGQIDFKIESIDYANPEYSISSLVQSFLNLILPANTLYSVVSNRRIKGAKWKIVALGFVSLILLIIFSPIIILFFLISLFSKRTAAMIVVAKHNARN
jgi:SAM-dependent methyltransferase